MVSLGCQHSEVGANGSQYGVSGLEQMIDMAPDIYAMYTEIIRHCVHYIISVPSLGMESIVQPVWITRTTF